MSESGVVVLLGIIVVSLFLFGLTRSVHVYQECAQNNGVVVKVVEFGDGLECVQRR